MASYLQVENLTKTYGDLYLFKDISFGIAKDDKTGLIAKNGAGKSTLMNIIAGLESADRGNVVFRNDVSIGYLSQNPSCNPALTVMQQAFASSNDVIKAIGEYENALQHHDDERLQNAMEAMDHLNAWDFEMRIKQILTQLKIDNFDQPMAQLSGGQRKRVALANVLINEPDFLILDEPTNHLDMEMVEWLEEYFKKVKCTLFMVTHDRYFLDRVCSNIIEIDNNTVYEYTGNYSYYLEKREERIQSLNASIDKAKNLLKTELEWMRRMPKARGTKAKYREDNFYKVQEKASMKTDEKSVQLNIVTKRLGKKVLEFENIQKAYGDNVLIKDFSYKFERYEKIGIIGKNGCGKSTMLNIFTGKESLDGGTVELGEVVEVGYYRQDGMSFNDGDRVIDIIKDIAENILLGDGKTLSPSQFLEHFLFPPELQYSHVSKLSGGERRRLYLMTILMKNPNFLILDEPTNDLDIMTLNVLEDYLQTFKGCVIIVSHDRYFMDKIVDNLFVFEGEGAIRIFPGTFSDYSAWLAENEKNEKKLAKETKKEEPNIASAPIAVKRKFSFKEKMEFETLAADIKTLAAERQSLQAAMNNGNFDSDKAVRLATITELIDAKELRWLELSEWA
jgi:ATP-binding cassette subfamily F protein uup